MSDINGILSIHIVQCAVGVVISTSVIITSINSTCGRILTNEPTTTTTHPQSNSSDIHHEYIPLHHHSKQPRAFSSNWFESEYRLPPLPLSSYIANIAA